MASMDLFAKEMPVDAKRFDAMTRLLTLRPSRRRAVPLITGLLAATCSGIMPAFAGNNKPKKKKKITLCFDGQTIEASGKRKKKNLLKRGATQGACVCTPRCAGTCGDDGCGGVCRCGAGFICVSGACQSCDVVFNGNAITSGTALQTRLQLGGTIRVCPGRYQGNFLLNATTSLIGAGDGEDQASNTVLDGNRTGRVMDIGNGVSVTLQGVRITGGDGLGNGGGIRSAGRLALTNCSVSGNRADRGGGIAHTSAATGALELTNCRITGNEALVGNGAGLILENTTQQVTIKGCTISGNTSSLAGGGIQKDAGSCAITGTEISGNKAVANGGGVLNAGTMSFDGACRITNNTSDAQGGGIFNEAGSTVTLNGATVTGNSPQNCAGTAVPGCAG